VRQRLFYCWLLLAIMGPGCGGPPAAPPSADQVKEIRVTVQRPPGPKDACAATLTARTDIVEVVDWPASIDWSQPGADPAVITLPQPDGDIEVTTTSGTTRRYGFYWDGGFLADRFIRGGDMGRLRELVRRFCGPAEPPG
jgi:hypothetical protein